MFTIREECLDDADDIRAINEAAFGQPAEARLVDLLRASGDTFLSLVAETDGRVVGHILFTPVSLEWEGSSYRGMGLAPMAVFPESQRRGIGSALVRKGLAQIEASGCPFVVLGHPRYYPRFGFRRASEYGLRCEWDVPDEAFMVLRIRRRAHSSAGRPRTVPARVQ